MAEGLLQGKSAVVTGSGSGVGRAAAELFARHGAKVVCADVRTDWLEEVVAGIKKAGGQAIAARCDVSKRAEVEAAVKTAVESFGRLDVMYNNAGIASPSVAPGKMGQLVDNTEEQIERLIGVNMRGVMYGCQLAIEQFRKQGGGGAIVNTASVAGMMGWGGTLYGATKGAIVNLTRTLALEVAAEGIRVNNVCPGAMATNFGGGFLLAEGVKEKMALSQPLRRVVEPEDVAQAALFLASDLARTITGVNLPVDSGMSAGR